MWREFEGAQELIESFNTTSMFIASESMRDLLRCKYLCFCTSKASSKLSTSDPVELLAWKRRWEVARARGAEGNVAV